MNSRVDLDWAKRQLVAAGVEQPVATSVMRLMTELETMNFESDAQRVTVLQLFGKLATGEALVADDDTVWVNNRNAVAMGSRVMVASTAFPLASGRSTENGRQGVVIGLRRGVAHVRYDRLPGADDDAVLDVGVVDIRLLLVGDGPA